MATQKHIEGLRQRCDAARATYHAASHVIEMRLQAIESPTPEEWAAEESARIALVAARRALAEAAVGIRAHAQSIGHSQRDTHIQ